MTRQLILCPLFTAILLTAGCSSHRSPRLQVLRLATTTSTRDSGLLGVLVPRFERQQQVRVDVIAVGTGAALKLGEAGDVDVVFVHARQAEDAFMAAGHGIRREDVMYNTFEILGPSADPAGVRGLDPASALQKIAAGGFVFVSRGDNSGTHKREHLLWKKGGGQPVWTDYVETGQGMGITLTIADQMQAYVLTDRGTYLRFKNKIDLAPLVTNSPDLRNPYGIIVVNPAKHPAIRADLANAFVDYVVSADVQKRIQNYQVEGESLFHPLRLTGSKEAVSNQRSAVSQKDLPSAGH